MKRFIGLIVLLAIGLCFVSNAEEYDFSSYELKDLLDMELKIQKEILNRSPDEEFVLYSGRYVVGDNLDPGNYIFMCASLYSGEVYTKVKKYSIDDSTFNNVLDETYLRVGDTYQMNLEVDQIIIVEDGIVTFIKRK